jgi:signal transduction histidine kinase/CheY-like chemotaxis protein/HPt (histidine-containing phosphotransfer) domain-containing protein
MKHRPELIRFLLPGFYAVALLFVVLHAWDIQTEVRRDSGPLYRNLRESPAYAKRGFDPAALMEIPSESGGWVQYPSTSPSRRIINSGLPDLPKRSYLSPFGRPAEEFTIVFLIEIDDKALAHMSGSISMTPGFSFAGVGENWEFFLNGTLICSEMHLDKNGQVKENRTWRDVHFPADGLLFVPGTNILTLRVVGDPTYTATGPFYSAAPIYMEDYRIIEGRQYNFLLVVLGGIFIFSGAYYLLLFLSIKNKREIFNLYFGVFSILLCIYAITRHGMVNYLIPNSSVSIRLEYGSLILMVPVFCMFIETLMKGKVTKISWGYLAFCSFLSLTQTFFCNQYGEEIMEIWDVTTMIYYGYIVIYDIIYFLLWGRYKEKYRKRDIHLNMPVSSIVIGVIASYLCGLYDILDVLFFKNSYTFFQYSIFVVHIGMVFALSQRFSGMYKRLEQSNVLLELAVQERTRELEEQTKIAVQASKTKSDFLATMSHEIRSPLNAIIGLSEIELRGGLPEASRNNVTQILNSGSVLLGIINDILDISKIEARAFKLVPVEYETAPFISDTVNLNRVRIGLKPIKFVLEIDENFPRKLIGDELRVKQVLSNILSNAVKYTREGTVTLTVGSKDFSRRRERKAFLRFVVRDTGIGMRDEDVRKLFSGYTQLDTNTNRTIEGTGLGLEITKNLVEMMGGTITVESEYGKGSVFTITLMQGLPDMADTQFIGEETAQALRSFRYAAGSREAVIERSWMPYGKVLVVDDMPVNVHVMRGLLEPYGLTVESALSGQEAIDKVQAASYDLVFMDHMMPEMDGVEAVRIIRRWEEEHGKHKKHTKLTGTARVAIIALTANALVGSMEMFLQKGFDGFISKPVDIMQLNEALNRWVRDKQSRETLQQAEREKNHKDEIISVEKTPAVAFDIPGVNTVEGIKMTGGTLAAYKQVLTVFRRDVMRRLPLLQQALNTETLPSFVIQVHALKSALASLGAGNLSAVAARLEAAGKVGDTVAIAEALPEFTKGLGGLAENIEAVLEADNAAVSSNETPLSFVPVSMLGELKKALMSQRTQDIDQILEALMKESVDTKTKGALEKISEAVLITEFDSAIKIINELAKG